MVFSTKQVIAGLKLHDCLEVAVLPSVAVSLIHALRVVSTQLHSIVMSEEHLLDHSVVLHKSL